MTDESDTPLDLRSPCGSQGNIVSIPTARNVSQSHPESVRRTVRLRRLPESLTRLCHGPARNRDMPGPGPERETPHPACRVAAGSSRSRAVIQTVPCLPRPCTRGRARHVGVGSKRGAGHGSPGHGLPHNQVGPRPLDQTGPERHGQDRSGPKRACEPLGPVGATLGLPVLSLDQSGDERHPRQTHTDCCGGWGACGLTLQADWNVTINMAGRHVLPGAPCSLSLSLTSLLGRRCAGTGSPLIPDSCGRVCVGHPPSCPGLHSDESRASFPDFNATAGLAMDMAVDHPCLAAELNGCG